ncbi:hypothetical protein [Methylorubrum thiocyanatum]
MAKRLRRWRAAARSWSADVRLLRERRLIAGSGLFDETLYLYEAPDVMREEAEPIEHFCRFGWREGRRPNLYFDPSWYRTRHVLGPDVNPLAHYIRTGEADGYRPVSYFDPAWYAHAYRLPRETSPLAHYLTHRRSQLFAPNPHFDLAFYLGRYGAEIGPNRDPFAHLLRCGGGRDLDPSPTFDTAAYRRARMTGNPAPAETPWGAADLRVPLVHAIDAQYRRS